MKQMIARIDDALHAQLKARAASEGRSLNDLVTEALAAAVGRVATRQVVRDRARAAGLLVVPARPERTPGRGRALATTRGLSSAASDALDAERADR